MKFDIEKFSFTIALVLFSLTFHAQEDQNKVPFVAYWDVGDTYNFRMTQVTTQWSDGVKQSPDSSSIVMKFEVIDSTATSYSVKLSFSDEYDSSQKDLPAFLKEKMADLKALDVIYKTSELGEYLGIENWQEIADQGKEVQAMVSEYLEKEKMPKELSGAFNAFFDLFASKEGIETVVFKELIMFHYPLGAEFDKNEVLEYVDQLPNIFGGDPIKGNTKVYFESVDFETSHCVFRHKMELDKDDTKALILDVFKEMGLKDKEVKKKLKVSKFEISDNNRFEFYFYPGIPIKIETERTVLMDIGPNKGKKVDRMTIEMLGLH